mgnify:CR=1 FL=1
MDRLDKFHLVQDEYRKLDAQWLRLHVVILSLLAALVMLMEIAMYFILESNNLVSSSPQVYLLKYLLFPTAWDGICVVLAWWAVGTPHLSEKVKRYVLSLAFSLAAFVLSFVHGAFLNAYSGLTIPVLLTAFYRDVRLTSVTAGICVLLQLISAFFIHWDLDKVYSANYYAEILVALLILVFVYIICFVIIRFDNKRHLIIAKNEQERRRLQRELLTDDLTGIYNKVALRDFLEHLDERKAIADFHIVMMDIDDFKRVNDTLGHLQGDIALRIVGQVIHTHCPVNTAFRFGGDEFCLLFENMSSDEVRSRIQSMQQDYLAQTRLEVAQPIALSAGIATGRKGESASQLLERADQALYRAKEQRNAIYLAP